MYKMFLSMLVAGAMVTGFSSVASAGCGHCAPAAEEAHDHCAKCGAIAGSEACKAACAAVEEGKAAVEEGKAAVEGALQAVEGAVAE